MSLAVPSAPTLDGLAAELAAERAARAAAETESAALREQITRLTHFRERAYGLTDRLPLAVLLTDPAGHIMLLNQSYADLFGVKAVDWIGRLSAELLPVISAQFHDPADFLGRTRAITARGQGKLSELMALRDGRSVERDTIPLPDGGWLIGYREVTERDRARQDQYRAEARMAQVLRETRVGTLLLDADRRVVMVNQYLLDLFGLPEAPDSMIGQSSDVVRERMLKAFANPVAARALSERGRQNGLDGRPATVPPLLLANGRTVEMAVQPLTEAAGGGSLVTYRDVTEREQARRAQRRSEARAARLVRELPLGVLLTDATGRVLLANAELARLLKLADSPAALVGQPLKRLLQRALPAFARPAEVRGWSRVIPRGAMPVRNLQLALADGRVIEIDAQPLPDAEGGGWLLVVRDVTAREQARREVTEQRAFYEGVLNHLPSDVVVIDANHRYRFVNPAAVADPAIRHWLIGHTDTEYCHYRDRSVTLAEVRAARFAEAVRERRMVAWEEEMPATDGSPRTLRRQYQPVFDLATGELRMMIGYGFDVTALRAAQRAIDEQRTFYETVLDNLPADVAVYDGELRYRYVNPQAQPDPALRQWVIGHTWDEYVAHAQVSDARAEQRRQVLDQVLRTRQSVAWDEQIPAPVTGVVRTLRRHLRPLSHPDGTPYLLIGYGVDITAVRAAQRTAEEAARARENFLANMSHEIRTPLNGILGMVALLAKTRLTPRQQEFLEIVGTSGRHLLALLNDVLDMAKINSGHLELEEAPFRLADTLRTASQGIAFRGNEQGVTLSVESAGVVALGVVVGDAYRLQQVLLNLLSNAIKFAPGGHITLGARVLSQTDDTACVRFTVHDTGVGIPTDRQEAVFEDFTQAYTDTTRRFGGTGLGLAISQRLVSRMGGHLLVSSVPDEGTTFAFTLPLARATAEVEATLNATPTLGGRADAAPIPSLDGLLVLVVEDQDVNRLLARLLLEANGATVVEAESGPQALSWLASHSPPAVVLMDIQMPGMSGLDVTRRIRALSDPVRAAVPIVALTANAFRTDVERYLAAGMNACLTKPFEEAELVRLVAALAEPAGKPKDKKKGKRKAKAEPATEAPAPLTEAAPLPYPATLLRVGRNDPAFAQRVIAAFCAGGPAAMAALRAAQEARDAPAAAAASHRLVPSIRLFDEEALAETLSEIEGLPATDPNWPDALAYAIQELEALLARLDALVSPKE